MFLKYRVVCLGKEDSHKSVESKYLTAVISCIEPLHIGKELSGYFEVIDAPNGANVGMTFFVGVTLKELK